MDQDAIKELLSKIVNDDNTGAKEDFESIISQKLNLALDAKKTEVAQSVYASEADPNEVEDGESEQDTIGTEDELQ